MRESSLLQKILCIFLSACMLTGLFISLEGNVKVEAASDEMDEYTYTNENNEQVTVRVSRTNGDFEYISFPFGYDTRGGYVFATIDPVGKGFKKDMIQVWLSEGGPCGDKTVCNSWEEYMKSRKLLNKYDHPNLEGRSTNQTFLPLMLWLIWLPPNAGLPR